MKKLSFIIISMLLLSACVAERPEKPPKEMMIMLCTQDAKQCPDGSWVSRQAPDCQFAACPSQSNQ